MNVVACPSRAETLEWFKEGLSWLYEEFDVDGIQVEVGDYVLCHCPECNARRGGREVKTPYCIEDMLFTYEAAVEVSRAHKPDAWVICETYSSPAKPVKEDTPDWYGWHSMPDEDRRKLAALPDGTILHWGVDKSLGGYARHSWEEPVYVPLKDNILRIHAGSQWAMNGPADWAVNLVWQLVKSARIQGINGASLFGEESAFAPPNEANYLAFEEAAGLGKPNPGCDERLFYAQTLDPLYGGDGLARRWRELYIKGSMLILGERLNHLRSSCQPLEILTDDPDIRVKALTDSNAQKAEAIRKYYDEARAISRTLSGDACGRWSWLENKLWNQRYILLTRP